MYYFEVVNRSEGATIYDVSVKLKEVIPEAEHLKWLPVLLQQKHDNPSSYGDFSHSFDLNPNEPKNIDLVSAFYKDDHFNVHHIVRGGVNQKVPLAGRHRLKIMVNAKDMPILFKWFEVWMDEEGVLQCEMERVQARKPSPAALPR
jgi:hypothetical protein